MEYIMPEVYESFVGIPMISSEAKLNAPAQKLHLFFGVGNKVVHHLVRQYSPVLAATAIMGCSVDRRQGHHGPHERGNPMGIQR